MNLSVRCFVFLAISFFLPVFARAGSIDVINLSGQCHAVSGGTFWDGELDEYYELSCYPVEGSSAGSYSRAGDFSVFGDAAGDIFTNIKGAYAGSTYLFTPKYSDLILNLSGYIWFTIEETSASAVLTDTATQDVLVDFKYSSTLNLSPDQRDEDGNWYFDEDFFLSGLDTNRFYEFKIQALASRGDGGTALLNAEYSEVPAPATILLLLFGTMLAGKFKYSN